MTFRDLRKRFSANNTDDNNNFVTQLSSNNNNNNKFDIFANKPFWINDIEQHKLEDIRTKGYCCFNHIIGLPKKDGKELRIFDYEQQLIQALDNNSDIFVKKARGLGITEILLRYMSWLAVKDSTYNNCKFDIVTGPRIDLAEEEVDRIRLLFANAKLVPQPIILKQTGSIIYLNGVTIEAFPSHHVSTMRGYTDLKFIFIDEASFFAIGEQDEVRAVCEGYRAKTEPKIVIVSTPYKPSGFFYDIDKDLNSLFTKLLFHYSVGLNKIYSTEQIEKEKNQPYFRREFELAYSVGVGNVFTEQSILYAEELGRQYTKNGTSFVEGSDKSLGIDPSFGSSKTAFCVVEYIDDQVIHVIYTKQFENSSTERMVDHAWHLIKKYDLNNGSNKVYVDSSQPGFIRSLKNSIGEFMQYEQLTEKAKKNKWPISNYRSISGDETKNIVIYLYESGIEQEFIDLELDIPTVISILKKEHNNNIYKGVSKRREIEFPFIGFNMYVILGCHS